MGEDGREGAERCEVKDTTGEDGGLARGGNLEAFKGRRGRV